MWNCTQSLFYIENLKIRKIWPLRGTFGLRWPWRSLAAQFPIAENESRDYNWYCCKFLGRSVPNWAHASTLKFPNLVKIAKFGLISHLPTPIPNKPHTNRISPERSRRVLHDSTFRNVDRSSYHGYMDQKLSRFCTSFVNGGLVV